MLPIDNRGSLGGAGMGSGELPPAAAGFSRQSGFVLSLLPSFPLFLSVFFNQEHAMLLYSKDTRLSKALFH